MTDSAEPPAALERLSPSADTDVEAELFVRSLAPVGGKNQQEDLVERLNGLREAKRLDEFCVTVWGNSVCPDGPLSEVGGGEHIVSAIADFYALAAKRDLSIAPFFRTTTVDASIADEEFKRIVPPQRCLALSDAGGDLISVFPCLVDGVVYTPAAAVDYLEEASERTASALRGNSR